MSLPMPQYNVYESFQNILSMGEFLEQRFENDGDGNPVYRGISTIPNADTSEPIWAILKIYYVGGSAVRTQLPDNGLKFGYTWDDRATYFS